MFRHKTWYLLEYAGVRAEGMATEQLLGDLQRETDPRQQPRARQALTTGALGYGYFVASVAFTQGTENQPVMTSRSESAVGHS